MRKLIRIIFMDVLKSRFVIIYTLLLLVMSWSVFSLEDNIAKGLLSLLNLVLLTIPLISVMYSTSYLYNSSEFVELLLSQPVKRSKIWISIFVGLSMALGAACMIGIGLPVLLYSPNAIGFMLLLTGFLITLVFISLAMWCSMITRDKAKGIGISIMLWLFFSLLFDGIVLFLLFQLSDYPIEKFMIGVSMLNPVMLARILILLQLDVSAMMGYTGAIFRNFFGTNGGIILSFLILILWAVIPFLISLKKFKSKDL